MRAIRALLAASTLLTTLAVAQEGAAELRQSWASPIDQMNVLWGTGTAFDSTGRIYLASMNYPHRGSEEWNMVLWRLSRRGELLWAREFDRGVAGGDDAGRDVAVGPDDSVHVVGYSETAPDVPGKYNYSAVATVLKYSSSGELLWSYDYPAVFADVWTEDGGIAVGPDGGVYVCSCVGVPPDWHPVLLKLSPEGVLQWSRAITVARSIALSPDGRFAYVTGPLKKNFFDPQSRIVVQKFSTGNGRLLWTYRNASGFAQAYDVAVDAAGMVYAVGVRPTPEPFRANGNAYNAVVVKLSPGRRVLWVSDLSTKGVPELALHGSRGSAIAVGAGGRIVVTGRSTQGNPLGYDDDSYSNRLLMLAEMSPATGAVTWFKRYDYGLEGGHYDDEGLDLVASGDSLGLIATTLGLNEAGLVAGHYSFFKFSVR